MIAAVFVIGAATLPACDTGSSAAPSAGVVPIGPSRSAFPDDVLFSPDQMESLLRDRAENSRGAGDTLTIVPLVFDGNGYLYSPLGFNLALDSLLSVQGRESGGDGSMGDTYFTDIATFKAVVRNGGSSSGITFEEMYPGRYGPATQLSQSVETYVIPFDPYVCSYDPVTCPGNPPPSPTPPIPPPSGRATTTSNTPGAPPAWAPIWRGDIVSGHRVGSNPFGHTTIVTRLDNSQATGGAFTDARTLVMDAKADGPYSDQVVERPARRYWIDEGRTTQAYVLYHPQASGAHRNTAVSYARTQDPDIYSLLTPKYDRLTWYCSKLVWRAYLDATGDNLDPDSGYFVLPEDVEDSGHLRIIHSANS